MRKYIYIYIYIFFNWLYLNLWFTDLRSVPQVPNQLQEDPVRNFELKQKTKLSNQSFNLSIALTSLIGKSCIIGNYFASSLPYLTKQVFFFFWAPFFTFFNSSQYLIHTKHLFIHIYLWQIINKIFDWSAILQRKFMLNLYIKKLLHLYILKNKTI